MAGCGGKKRTESKVRPLASPTASPSNPETIAAQLNVLLAAVRVDLGLPSHSSPLPEHWIDTAMVAELVEHAQKLLEERARQESKSGGGGGCASGEGKDTASSSGSLLQSSREIVSHH